MSAYPTGDAADALPHGARVPATGERVPCGEAEARPKPRAHEYAAYWRPLGGGDRLLVEVRGPLPGHLLDRLETLAREMRDACLGHGVRFLDIGPFVRGANAVGRRRALALDD
jgi:hypothetical protein